MLEFNCLMHPPKFLVRLTKHRFTFALNETEVHIVPEVTKWAVEKKWLVAHITGKETNEDVIGQISGYRVDIRDKSIYVVYDALNGNPHVEALLSAHMKDEWLTVKIEETEKPYGLEKGTKRKTDWNSRS